MNQHGGRRWSATKAFLRPALGRPNLTVMTHAHARSLVLQEKDGVKRATGIDLVVEGRGEGRGRARRAVILAAGSIGAPQIPPPSGIGPPNLLEQHGFAHAHLVPLV